MFMHQSEHEGSGADMQVKKKKNAETYSLDYQAERCYYAAEVKDLDRNSTLDIYVYLSSLYDF